MVGWRHFLACTYVLHFVCFGEETGNCMHFLVILSLKTLWADVKHWRTALHRFYVYRKPISSLRSRNLKVIKKCVHLKCICVWCLDNWSRILSGKPFNIFSMASLKTLQFRLTLTPLFTATHAFLISLSPFFFIICDWGSPCFLCRRTADESRTMIGVFFLFWWPSIYVSYLFTVICKILKKANFNFRESWFGFFFYFLRCASVNGMFHIRLKVHNKYTA
jgi:hypothetical protein